MSCPRDDLLSAFCDNEAPPKEAESIRKHLTDHGGCERCQQIVDRIQKIKVRMESLIDEPMLLRLKDRIQNDRARRRFWIQVAASVLILVPVGLGVTEATGVTHFIPYVIQIATGEGDLLVEVDDPSIKVLIEGEDLTISGDGVQEVRLRPGTYKVRGFQDGKQVKQELVTITRGGKRMVKISLDGITSTVSREPVTSVASIGTFVVLSGGDGKENKFDSLEDAIRNARHHDTVEIRGDGPFWSNKITISQKALTIRAGTGFRPVLKLLPNVAATAEPLIKTDSPLALEGLELWRVSEKESGYFEERRLEPWLIDTTRSPFYAAHCRFIIKPLRDCVHASDSLDCVFVSCIFNGRHGVSWHPQDRARLVMQNCLQTGGSAVHAYYENRNTKDLRLRFEGNTFLGEEVFKLVFKEKPNQLASPESAPVFHIDTERNVIEAQNALLKVTVDEKLLPDLRESRDPALIKKLIAWREKQNVYSTRKFYLDCWAWQAARRFADWNEFWAIAPSDSVEGTLRFQAEDVRSKIGAETESFDPLDFRLLSVSTSDGTLAAEEGMGVDVERVGPGEAYTRWVQDKSNYTKWQRISEQKPLAGVRVGVVIPHENFWFDDFQIQQLFKDRGAVVSVVSSASGDASPQKEGDERKPPVPIDIALDRTIASKFDAVLICGGQGRGQLISDSVTSAALSKLCKDLLAADRFVMGIGDGVEVLAKLGLLEGIEVTTHAKNLQTIEEHGGTLLVQEGKDGKLKPVKPVVPTGNIITVWHSDYANGFVDELVKGLNKRDWTTIFPSAGQSGDTSVPTAPEK